MLDRELILIAQARILADWVDRRFSTTLAAALADRVLMAALDLSRNKALKTRLRPFRGGKIPDRRGQLFTTDARLAELLRPPASAADLQPILALLRYYGVVLLPQAPGSGAPIHDILANISRVEAKLERARFDTQTAAVESFAEGFKQKTAKDNRSLVDTSSVDSGWCVPEPEEKQRRPDLHRTFAAPVSTLIGRVRSYYSKWRAAQYLQHFWNEFSVDAYLVTGRTSDGFYTRSDALAFFDALDRACRDAAPPGPFAWKGLYNDLQVAAEIDRRFGQGRILTGVDGHGPGSRMHIHLDLRPLQIVPDRSTGFRIDGERIVLT